jgi:hypothetical protein
MKDTGDAAWDETKKRSGDAYEWSEDTIDKGRERMKEEL